jgi:hypothetical protein
VGVAPVTPRAPLSSPSSSEPSARTPGPALTQAAPRAKASANNIVLKGYELTEPDSPVLRPSKTPVKAVKVKQKPTKKRAAEKEYTVDKFICRPRAGIIKVLWTAGDTTEETVKQLKKNLDTKTYNRLVRGLKTC